MSQPVGSGSTGDAYAAYVTAQAAYDAALAKVHEPAAQTAMTQNQAAVGSTLAEVRLDQAAQNLRAAEKKAGYG